MLELDKIGEKMHTFYRLSGVVQVELFMQGPKLGEGYEWVQHHPYCWTEQTSTHGPESDPNHPIYDLHLFGEHHKTFMSRQHRRSK